MSLDQLTRDAILRVGEVSEVTGRKVIIKVDRDKNLSDMFFDGDILRNISVNSYVEIKKGFLGIVGKVDGENIDEDFNRSDFETNTNRRYLTVSLVGYISQNGIFTGGIKELPLIGNEAYIVTKEKIHQIHNLIGNSTLSISIASSDSDNFDLVFPIDGLFNSHIAIFGNTGSGKSNTLTALFQELIRTLDQRNSEKFRQNTKFILFDFNGEYTGDGCITTKKKVYNLTTHHYNGDKLPFDESDLLEIEMLSILSDATEKTQKPFLRRTLSLYNHVQEKSDSEEYFRNLLRNRIKDILKMSEKTKVDLLLNYLEEILPEADSEGNLFDISQDIDWHNTQKEFKLKKGQNIFLKSQPEYIEQTNIYLHVNNFEFSTDSISNFIAFLYLQLIRDVIANRAQNEHIAPVIGRLRNKKIDIEKLFNTTSEDEFWCENFVVINLNETNLDMKKTLPLLLCKKIYFEHKKEENQKSLNIIIDEAHNILSSESYREAETWKDYRLETFEEIIKEGRKFGVFVTISSQRPNDISPTITSQAHNYFIHRLINQKDLATISSAVSYIDRMMEESIPTLPTGTCIFSGVASQRPLKINVTELADGFKPSSNTIKFEAIVPKISDNSSD